MCHRLNLVGNFLCICYESVLPNMLLHTIQLVNKDTEQVIGVPVPVIPQDREPVDEIADKEPYRSKEVSHYLSFTIVRMLSSSSHGRTQSGVHSQSSKKLLHLVPNTAKGGF